jgi:glycosyltransferase involved in cell wall biosynthesis
MRILHIVPSYFPAVRYGGPIVSVHGLCRALVEAGHQVDVFTTLVNGDRDLEIDAGVRIDVDAVGVYYFPTARPRRWYYSTRMSAALRTQIHAYDMVHIHALFLHPISAAAKAALRTHVPYLISPRGMLVRSLFEQRSHWLKTAWMSLVGRRILEQAAAVHVTSALEHAHRVQFQGPAQVKQRDEWYARAGMFVLPSRSENFANTVLEAMAAGCPVIVTPAVGLSSIVRDSECGIVCDDTPAVLSTAMRRIATDDKLAAAMGVRGQRAVEEGFLWSTVAAKMSAVYAQIAQQWR